MREDIMNYQNAVFKPCEKSEIEKLIELFQVQFKTSSNWGIEKVEINKIIPLCKHVYTDRLNFAQNSIEMCLQEDIPIFYPYLECFANGDKHLVVPPIVEERQRHLYLTDGMHRIYSLLKLEVPTAYILLTHECVLPLPGKPLKWENVTQMAEQLPVNKNFEDYVPSGLTGYSKFCNSDVFWRRRVKNGV